MVKYHERFKLVDGFKVTEHPSYFTWSNMRRRCNDKYHDAYANYGGRGIKVCDEWNTSFETFAKDMGIKPNGFSIERIDNDKGYFKENCKWASKQEQSENKRIYKTNNTGVTGVTIQSSGFYQAVCNIEKVRYNLGSFKTIEEAKQARLKFLEIYPTDKESALKLLGTKVRLKSSTGINGIGKSGIGFTVNITENKVRKYLGYSGTLEGAKQILADYNDKK